MLHAKRPAIIYDTSTYTAGIARQVKAGLAEAGDPVVAMVSVTTNESKSKYASAVNKVAKSHPGLLYIAAYCAGAGAIAKAAGDVHL